MPYKAHRMRAEIPMHLVMLWRVIPYGKIEKKHRCLGVFDKDHYLKMVGEEGLEPLSKTSGKTGVAVQSGAESGAVDAAISPMDPQLRAIIDVWPTLPATIRAEVTRIACEKGGK